MTQRTPEPHRGWGHSASTGSHRYRVRRHTASTGIAGLIRAEQEAGREVIVVPAGADKAHSLRRFAEVLSFPPYVGANLDALYDALRRCAEERPGGWSLIWDETRSLQEGDLAAYHGIVAVLADLVDEAPHLHVVVVDR